jgi:hypothetical protein
MRVIAASDSLRAMQTMRRRAVCAGSILQNSLPMPLSANEEPPVVATCGTLFGLGQACRCDMSPSAPMEGGHVGATCHPQRGWRGSCRDCMACSVRAEGHGRRGTEGGQRGWRAGCRRDMDDSARVEGDGNVRAGLMRSISVQRVFARDLGIPRVSIHRAS